LEELGTTEIVEHPAPAEAPTKTNTPLLECMGYDPVTLDTLIERSSLTTESLSSMLLVLELEGKVASLPGGRYQRID
jgi:DNA processing protein